LCLSLAFVSQALSDVVELKNGELIKCKVVKEMQNLVKVRMPHRGKIVTTFLNRGSVKSISKTSDVENRKFFQRGGVHNPGRNYEPVYYSGSAAAARTGRGPSRGRKSSAKGKAKAKATTRKRGVEARRERSKARAKARSERFGRRSSTRSTSSTGASTGVSSSSAASPSTSSSAGR
jgi:hypothetical protein